MQQDPVTQSCQMPQKHVSGPSNHFQHRASHTRPNDPSVMELPDVPDKWKAYEPPSKDNAVKKRKITKDGSAKDASATGSSSSKNAPPGAPKDLVMSSLGERKAVR